MNQIDGLFLYQQTRGSAPDFSQIQMLSHVTKILRIAIFQSWNANYQNSYLYNYCWFSRLLQFVTSNTKKLLDPRYSPLFTKLNLKLR